MRRQTLLEASPTFRGLLALLRQRPGLLSAIGPGEGAVPLLAAGLAAELETALLVVAAEEERARELSTAVSFYLSQLSPPAGEEEPGKERLESLHFPALHPEDLRSEVSANEACRTGNEN